MLSSTNTCSGGIMCKGSVTGLQVFISIIDEPGLCHTWQVVLYDI